MLIAVDTEHACEADRLAHGVPLSANLAAQPRDLAERTGAALLLEQENAPS